MIRQKNRLAPLLLLVPLLLIVTWRSGYQDRIPAVEQLPPVGSLHNDELLAAGDKVFLARLLIVWLQQFDTQAGRYISFRQQNYDVLTGWLGRVSELDPRSAYPLLLATRVYSRVNDPVRQRKMLDFVYAEFQKDPARHWRWLAEAVVMAKHRLKDLPLALKYARALADSPILVIPQWARESRQHVLRSMSELDDFRLLYGALYSGENDRSDANEMEDVDNFLKNMEKTSKSSAN